MTCYSVQPRDWIFVSAYGFLSFAKNLGKNIGKNISKNLSSKYSLKLLNHVKQSTTVHLKLLQKEQFQRQQKQLVIWLVIALLIKLQTNHHKILPIRLKVKRIPKERFISLNERQQIADKLKLI